MAVDDPQYVHVETEGLAEHGVATIRLARPPMNALDFRLQAELRAAAAQVTERADVRAVVVFGGEKVFAAGMDVKEMSTLSFTDMTDRVRGLQDSVNAIAAIPKPTVAAVTGYALGGGLELALACDRRVAGDNARLGLPEVTLGLLPGAGGTQRLPRLIGPSRAKDMIFTGRHVRAEEALAIGLVDEVVAPDDVYTAALAWATKVARGPAYAIRLAKLAVDEGLEVPLASGLAIERQAFAGVFATRDAATGMGSFVTDGPGKAVFTHG